MEVTTAAKIPPNAHEYMCASITKRGIIWLNAICSALYFKDYLYVRVMWFEPYDNLLIGPHWPSGWSHDPCLYKITPIKENGVIITATSLIEKIATIKPILGQYKPIWEARHGVLRININERIKKYGR